MNEQNTSGQARKGLLDTVKGKVKEVAGAVTGNDSLASEGQLQQAQAQQRKEANSAETVARAETSQAAEELGQVRRESAEERAAIGAEAAAAEEAARNRQQAEHRAAEEQQHRQVVQEQSRAVADARDETARAETVERSKTGAAAEEAVDATDEHRRAVREANAARDEADRVRRAAEGLSNDAGLS
ncbi:CsbD family protein [Rhodococcus opacus]|uniref:CsbD family protein n=1 Tax=Rhodococcus opacus TaxID=37919 RepID=UPI0029537DC5|nr:CsbD family protein [Rhodococcus opacus]MDV7087047.1 CsbD family protein [Rhodococcus opacus]